MQRIYNLEKWTRVGNGQALTFQGERPRTVRLEFNAPEPTLVYVSDDAAADGECVFLARVVGRDVVEFSPSGPFTLHADVPGRDGEAGEVYVLTADGDDVSITLEAPVSFTKLVERRRRSPELERMVQLMNRNMEERIAQATRELERRYSRDSEQRGIQRGLPAGTSLNEPAGVSGDAGRGPGEAKPPGSDRAIREGTGENGDGREERTAAAPA